MAAEHSIPCLQSVCSQGVRRQYMALQLRHLEQLLCFCFWDWTWKPAKPWWNTLLQEVSSETFADSKKTRCSYMARWFEMIKMVGSRDGAVVRAQWWERSPPTNVARVRFPDPASYVGWVCWFSTLLREVFSGCSGFPSPQKPTFDLICVNC